MKKFLIQSLVIILGISMGVYISTKLEILMNLNTIDKFIISENVNIVSGESEINYRSDLILVNSYIDSVVVDLKNNTTNNITGVKLYDSNLAYLQKNTADKLKSANKELMKYGYRIKIWDAYRPLSIQKKIWAAYPNASFVDNPFLGGSDNNKGVAVDVTLVDSDGNEIAVPYGYDEFEKRRTGNYSNDFKLTENIRLLTEVMERNGFYSSGEMWYHFVDNDVNNYKILDIKFRDLLKK